MSPPKLVTKIVALIVSVITLALVAASAF